MSTKRSNKTARVLNLIATPSETTSVEHEQPTTPAAVAAPVTSSEPQPAPEEKPKGKARSNTAKAKKVSKPETTMPASDAPAAESSSPVSEAPATEQPQAAPIPTPQPVVPIVQTVREKEQQVSDDIKSGLLQALSESEAVAQPPESRPADEPQAPVAVTDTIEEPEAIDAPAPKPETITEPSPKLEATPPTMPETQQPPAPEPEPAPQQPEQPRNTVKIPQPQAPSEQIYTPAGEQDVEYTNVLQELVEETSLYYIANMMQCRCQRCIADMKALALTNLPSKYVVLEKSKRAAYMSVYAARYEKDLSVQMMRACVIINEHPHH